MKKAASKKKEKAYYSYPGAPNTHRINLIGGIVSLIIFILIVVLNYTCYVSAISYLFQQKSMTPNDFHGYDSPLWIYLSALFLFSLITLPIVIKGGYQAIHTIQSAIVTIRRNYFPPLITPKIDNYCNIFEHVSRQSPIKPISSISCNFLTLLFGNRVNTSHTKENPLIESIGKDIRHRLFIMFFFSISMIIVIYGFKRVGLHKGFIFIKFHKSEIFFGMIARDIRRVIIYLPLIFLFLLDISAFTTQIFAVHWMLPRKKRKVTRQKKNFEISAFYNPERLFHQLPIIAEDLTFEAFPNKCYGHSPDETLFLSTKAPTPFRSTFFIEQHPQRISPYYNQSQYLLFSAGWFYLIISYGSYLIPFVLYAISERFKSPNYTATATFLIICSVLFLSDRAKRNSRFFFSTAHCLLKVSHFQSTGIFVDIKGTISKGEVNLGRSRSDSIESLNPVTRSDFFVRLFAADFLTLMEEKGSNRELLFYEESDKSMNWISCYYNAIHQMAKASIHPSGIDIHSAEFQSIIDGNTISNHSRKNTFSPSRSYKRPQGTSDDKRIRRWYGKNGENSTVIDCPNCFNSADNDQFSCPSCGFSFKETA